MKKQYNQAYFDYWYRDPIHRVKSADELKRKVQLVLAITEYHLGRSVESVLDVGCGEAVWLKPLRELRPKLRYLGLDASEYVVDKFGASRNILFCRLAELEQFQPPSAFDLLICADILHYVSSAELLLGVKEFSRLCSGVAFIETFCKGDDFIGDKVGFIARNATWYRKILSKNSWTHCGNHCYLGAAARANSVALEITQQ